MSIFSPTPSTSNDDPREAPRVGTKDGSGCADNDQPYTFGRRPTSAAMFPFTARQFGRLLALRGRVADGLTGSDDLQACGGSGSQSAPTATSGTITRLFYPCLSCGAMVAGAFQSEARVLCPRCAGRGDRDVVARLILADAGVLNR